MDFQLESAAFFAFALMVAIPAGIARAFFATSWLQVACAFVLWGLLVGILSVPMESTTIAWTVGAFLMMAFSWVGVPAAAYLLRKFDAPDRQIARTQR